MVWLMVVVLGALSLTSARHSHRGRADAVLAAPSIKVTDKQVTLTSSRYGTRVVVDLLGANVREWTSDITQATASNHLFNAKVARPHTPARGGIPICFPAWSHDITIDDEQYTKKYTSHGPAFNMTWKYVPDAVPTDSLAFELESNEYSRIMYTPDFKLRYTVNVTSPNTINLTLTATNPARDPQAPALHITPALHAYVAVDNATDAVVSGVEGLHYLDQTANNVERVQKGALTFPDGLPVNNIYKYVSTPKSASLRQGATAIDVSAPGLANFLVWQPGRDARIEDFGHDTWNRFVALEPGTVFETIRVAPGGSWSGSAQYSSHVRP
ncbi:uncharacterized protein L969DRAFT_55001 [Mixia osmundae IAM 14324]|uniref:Glucose-6-phosphate 1-epimerase n=1 Tax=Mixia osmundae (strain CBS 9802 / IAM 14324 / JCM 22182 / KY 12970) TaxID=764103 RepID=G7DW46_MIXOS|nr:uncharacterized protein L969DRAFT_55001 [Mixia osmundae IAM 14324]KEI36450.1 hypothetical protein L969DRAFT_55001 [Mixia osmundae IAM 14324]GAA94852.1 hypothetical protein E5Q_01506 [Mixia osmundae IAM 14324]